MGDFLGILLFFTFVILLFMDTIDNLYEFQHKAVELKKEIAKRKK